MVIYDILDVECQMGLVGNGGLETVRFCLVGHVYIVI